jgi:Putative Ig domain
VRFAAALGIFALAVVVASAQTTPRPTAPARLTIVPPERPVCREQQRCAIDLLASGGRGSYDWSIIQGKLPVGLSLDRNNGRIFGTPTVPGQSTLTIMVRDALGQTAQLRITITIRSLLDVVWQTAPALDQTNLSGSLRVTNYSGNEVMLTVVVVAVNEIGKAFTLGYQHFSLLPGATSPVIPFGMQLPPGRYQVRADAVGEVAAKNLIYRTALEAGPFAAP